ncbi:hypothetical protein PQB86_gp005 [Klebsiella phage Miami]|uniref:Uncharacterized protein n=1 Tax=Klebsiella phage Miami TaxID=2767581 RepID=A0A873WCN8_9CAUD|nr:hypothetical protein PQB86_gp005 [Klebsiella phage Miami]QPB09100.1 hypothetical protein CPT_Miami_005 [Klebsiella phage Miami]
MSRKSIVLRLPASTVADLKEFDEEAQLLILTACLSLAKRPTQEPVKEDEDTDPRSIISKEVDDILDTIDDNFEEADDGDEDEESSENRKDEQRTVIHQQMADFIEEFVGLLVDPETENYGVFSAIVMDDLNTPISWAADDKTGLTTIVYG